MRPGNKMSLQQLVHLTAGSPSSSKDIESLAIPGALKASILGIEIIHHKLSFVSKIDWQEKEPS